MSVPHAILRCLLAGPSYGYELQRTLARLSYFYPLKNVNVYPVLSELESKGYAESHSTLVAERTRRVYEITEEGREAFNLWLAAHPEGALPEVRDPVHLRLVLATEPVPDLGWVEESIEEIDKELETVRATFEENRERLARVAQLAWEELLHNLERRKSFLMRVDELRANRG